MADGDIPLPPEVQDVLARSNDILKARVMGMTLGALDRAEDLLAHGSPEVQMRVMQTVLPALVKALTQQEGEDELASMREEMESLREEVMKAGSMVVTVHEQGDIGDDDPDLSINPPMPGNVRPFVPGDNPPTLD
jgi:hypothetical protein